jgi:hypothetical protein
MSEVRIIAKSLMLNFSIFILKENNPLRHNPIDRFV